MTVQISRENLPKALLAFHKRFPEKEIGVWMGTDLKGNMHLGHLSTALYVFGEAAKMAGEMPMRFTLGINDETYRQEERYFESVGTLLGAVNSYLGEKFGPAVPVIRELRESDMLRDPAFRAEFPAISEGIRYDVYCPRGHMNGDFAGGMRELHYSCAACPEDDREHVFDPADPSSRFSFELGLNEGVIIARDRYLSPGIHGLGGDWNDGTGWLENALERSRERSPVKVLYAPLVLDMDGEKLSKRSGNGFMPGNLSPERLDRLHELVSDGRDTVAYADYAGVFGLR